MGLYFLRAAAAVRVKRRSKRRRQRRIAMQDSKTLVAPEIPLELLIEIMARMPPKSVMRFKCISKYWSSFFNSRYFCDLFRMAPSRPQARIYMTLLDHDNYCKSLLLSSSSPRTPLSSFEFDQDLTIRGMGGWYLRLLRGFICFIVSKKRARIYNPTTRQLVILPAIKSSLMAEYGNDILYFMGYDPLNDQYKLLNIVVHISEDMQKVRSEYWVFVLEAGGSWKRVAKEFQPHLPNPYELTKNGVLYYVAWTDMHTCVLVSFNFRSEEFNMLQVPRKAGDVLPRLKKKVTPIDYGGKVAVFDFTYLKRSGFVDLWVVEDWRTNEWSRKTIVLQPSQMHLVIDNKLRPKGTSLKGKVILVPQKLIYPFYILCYDFQINDLNKFEVKGIPDRWFSKSETSKYFDMDFMDTSESIKYLKT